MLKRRNVSRRGSICLFVPCDLLSKVGYRVVCRRRRFGESLEFRFKIPDVTLNSNVNMAQSDPRSGTGYLC